MEIFVVLILALNVYDHCQCTQIFWLQEKRGVLEEKNRKYILMRNPFLSLKGVISPVLLLYSDFSYRKYELLPTVQRNVFYCCRRLK